MNAYASPGRLAAASLIAAATALVAGPALAAEEWLENLEPRVLKYAAFTGDQTTNLNSTMVKWQEAITEFTEGKITFENYWSGSLLQALNTMEGVGDGVADIGQIIPSYHPAQLPVGTWLFGFGAALTGSTVHDVAAGGATALEINGTFQPLLEEYASHNLKFLQGTSTPAYNLLCNKPISTLEDAKGKRVRTSGAVWSETVEALGMTAVSIAFNEAYEGLQRGVIDCITLNPNQLAVGLVMKDVAPEYVPVTTAQLQSSTFVMNLDVWNSFPEELQDFITEQNVYAANRVWQEYLNVEAAAGDLFATGEVHTNDVAELEPVAAAQRAEYVKNMAASAPPSISDPEAFIDEYLQRQQYWISVLEDMGHEVVERDPEAIMKAFAGLREVDLSPFIERYNEEVVPTLLEE